MSDTELAWYDLTPSFELSLFILDWCIEGTLWWYLAITSLGLFVQLLLLLNKWSKHSNFAVTIFFKIETKFFAESQLEQVIIQRFFGYFDFLGSIFKRPTLKLDLIGILIWYHDSVVELSPSAYFLYDFCNCSLFCSLFSLVSIRYRTSFYVYLVLLRFGTWLRWLSFDTSVLWFHRTASLRSSIISAQVIWTRGAVIFLVIFSIIIFFLFRWFLCWSLNLLVFVLSHIISCINLLKIFWSLFILFIKTQYYLPFFVDFAERYHSF